MSIGDNMIQQYWRNLLVWARIPQLYQRAVVWWEYHSDLRQQLKAFRLLVQRRLIAWRNATFGAVMLVATRQIQSRAELSGMSQDEIMRAYRAGRLDYLTTCGDHARRGFFYGDKVFREWVNNGGQRHPFRPSEHGIPVAGTGLIDTGD
jgi:hypothetical protein